MPKRFEPFLERIGEIDADEIAEDVFAEVGRVDEADQGIDMVARLVGEGDENLAEELRIVGLDELAEDREPLRAWMLGQGPDRLDLEGRRSRFRPARQQIRREFLIARRDEPESLHALLVRRLIAFGFRKMPASSFSLTGCLSQRAIAVA